MPAADLRRDGIMSAPDELAPDRITADTDTDHSHAVTLYLDGTNRAVAARFDGWDIPPALGLVAAGTPGARVTLRMAREITTPKQEILTAYRNALEGLLDHPSTPSSARAVMVARVRFQLLTELEARA